jgi:hypothetical protein
MIIFPRKRSPYSNHPGHMYSYVLPTSPVILQLLLFSSTSPHGLPIGSLLSYLIQILVIWLTSSCTDQSPTATQGSFFPSFSSHHAFTSVHYSGWWLLVRVVIGKVAIDSPTRERACYNVLEPEINWKTCRLVVNCIKEGTPNGTARCWVVDARYWPWHCRCGCPGCLSWASIGQLDESRC